VNALLPISEPFPRFPPPQNHTHTRITHTMDPITRSFRVYKTIIQMLVDRKYLVTKEETELARQEFMANLEISEGDAEIPRDRMTLIKRLVGSYCFILLFLLCFCFVFALFFFFSGSHLHDCLFGCGRGQENR
jgi:RNA polymerase Rpb5, N-terminal domain